MSNDQPLDSVENYEPVARGPRWLVPIAIGVSLLLVLLVVVWLIARRGSAEHEVEPVVEVEVAATDRGEVREYVEGGGTLNALPGREAAILGLGMGGFVLMLATARKVEFISFASTAGVHVLDFARSGPDACSLDSCVERVSTNISNATGNA